MTSPEITDAAGPRPWTVETNLPYGEQPRIYDASGRLVAVVGNAEIDRQDEWEGNAELIVATVNALAAGAPGVKVKALEWTVPFNSTGIEYAFSLVGIYWAMRRYRREIEQWVWKQEGSRESSDFATLEAAKAAAQADYEARILSALEPARPALVAEPAPVVVQPLTAAPARADVTALREALERATASLRRAVDLAAAMLTNDPNEPVSDAGHVLLDVWKDELERLRSQLAALAQSAAPVQPEPSMRETMWGEVVDDDYEGIAFRLTEEGNRDGHHFLKEITLAAETFPLGTKITIAEPVQQAAPSGEGE